MIRITVYQDLRTPAWRHGLMICCNLKLQTLLPGSSWQTSANLKCEQPTLQPTRLILRKCPSFGDLRPMQQSYRGCVRTLQDPRGLSLETGLDEMPGARLINTCFNWQWFSRFRLFLPGLPAVRPRARKRQPAKCTFQTLSSGFNQSFNTYSI